MMPAPLFREVAGQAQESAKRWIVIVRQPCRTELDQFIISRHWSKHHLWKRRRDRRFAGKADAETHGHQMHQGVAANIEFLHTGVMIAAGQPSGEPVAECAVALGLA